MPSLAQVCLCLGVPRALGQADVCNSSSFPTNYNDIVFKGLHQENASTAEECQQACCEEIYKGLDCAVWQWADAAPASPAGTCWLGPSGLPSEAQKGWVSRGAAAPAPSPTPSSITCEAEHTACAAAYAVSGEGCCPFQNAVCCSNRQTCCPAGTTCQESGTYLTDCVDASGAVMSAGKSVCKPGPQNALSANKANVIVLGDSVSIGYTPHLGDALADVADVQHSPYDTRDGGAEETAYGFQCLDYLLRDPKGKLFEPEVLMFNFGLHDGPLGNDTIPGQQGNSSVYPGELEAIVQKLGNIYKDSKTQLVFALTSPMLCNENADGNVRALNNAALDIMQRNKVRVVDPHTAIIQKCGAVPQTSCFSHNQCFCPHCSGEGYAWLAQNVLAPYLRPLLSGLTAV